MKYTEGGGKLHIDTQRTEKNHTYSTEDGRKTHIQTKKMEVNHTRYTEEVHIFREGK